MIKQKIDYLFWKRTWFRLIFLMTPILAIIIGLGCEAIFDIEDFENVRTIMMISYGALFLLGMLDNDNIDGCDRKLTWRHKIKPFGTTNR